MHYSQDDMVSVMARYIQAITTSDLTDEQLQALETIDYVMAPVPDDDQLWENADNVLTKLGF